MVNLNNYPLHEAHVKGKIEWLNGMMFVTDQRKHCIPHFYSIPSFTGAPLHGNHWNCGSPWLSVGCLDNDNGFFVDRCILKT